MYLSTSLKLMKCGLFRFFVFWFVTVNTYTFCFWLDMASFVSYMQHAIDLEWAGDGL